MGTVCVGGDSRPVTTFHDSGCAHTDLTVYALNVIMLDVTDIMCRSVSGFSFKLWPRNVVACRGLRELTRVVFEDSSGRRL